MRVVAGLLFLCVALAVLVGGHLYIAQRLVLDLGLTSLVETFLLAGIVVLGTLLFVEPFASRLLPRALARKLAWPGFIWLGSGFLLIVALGASDAVLGLINWLGGESLQGAATKLEVARWRAALVLGVVVVAVGFGLRSALRLPDIRRVDVQLERWPQALDGFKIVQISDLHLGLLLGRSFAEAVTARCNALEADLVAITGDLVDGNVREIGPLAQPLAELRSRDGTFFVTGNHDHYSGVGPWVDRIQELGIRVLRNERTRIDRPGGSFDLAGVDDHRGGFGADGGGEDLGRALEGRDPQRALVLLAHDPSTFKKASRMGIDLQLSGHTHGGQIWPFVLLVRLAVRYTSGLHLAGPSVAPARLYVSRGTGFWGPPLRLFAPAEITLLTLRSAVAVRSAEAA